MVKLARTAGYIYSSGARDRVPWEGGQTRETKKRVRSTAGKAEDTTAGRKRESSERARHRETKRKEGPAIAAWHIHEDLCGGTLADLDFGLRSLRPQRGVVLKYIIKKKTS